MGAEIFVAGELVKVASLYVTAESGNQAIYLAIARVLEELPNEVDSVLFRSSHRQFIKRTKLRERFEVIADGKTLYFQKVRKQHIALLLADDAIKRQADCIANI
ncbi:hypothetical protein [Sutcliffiella cohnii]|nr:hypothetical protein [Sutcliffiella cohnii]